jgi:hypothetical protein
MEKIMLILFISDAIAVAMNIVAIQAGTVGDLIGTVIGATVRIAKNEGG